MGVVVISLLVALGWLFWIYVYFGERGRKP